MEDKKNPNALTHGITPSAPASLKPVEIDKWIGKVTPTFKHYYEERYNDLVRQYEQLANDYAINKMCYSFNNAENRAEFLKDENAYCTKYGLNDAQRKAILEKNVLAMIHAGGNIYYLAKFAGIFRLTGTQPRAPPRSASRLPRP